MLYAVIALIASLLGACCGLGGGVIVKPMLDAFTDSSASAVSAISTFTVLTIALTSVIKYAAQRTKVPLLRTVLTGIGAVAGGYLGTWLLQSLLSKQTDSFITLLQSVLLALFLAAAVLYMSFFRKRVSFSTKSPVAVISAGLLMGSVASFIGIGGGPINVALLVLLFSMELKQAAVSSLVIILMSQLTKTVVLILSGDLSTMAGDLSPLFIMLPVAFIGALLGAYLNKRLPEKAVLITYNIAVCGIIAVAVYNAVTAL